MQYPKSTVVLPCHSLEDFPIHYRGEQADSLLANWTALWHPALIASSQCRPSWCRMDHIQEQDPPQLVLVPTMLVAEFEDAFASFGVNRDDVRIISGMRRRAEILAEIFTDEMRKSWPAELAELAKDFFALGYAFLQVQLMTRQLRGSSVLDETAFESLLVEAANQAMTGDVGSAKKVLGGCFDQLAEEKNNYYPVQAEMIDLVLTASSTLNKGLAGQLEQRHPQNWLVEGHSLEKIRQTASWWPQLQDAVNAGQVRCVSCFARELVLPLMPLETLCNQLLANQARVQALDFEETRVFVQRRPGLTSSIPDVLESLDFLGALHVRFEPCQIPLASTGNIRWEGEGGGSVAALAGSPLDARDGHTFLRLSINIGEQIDSAHLATLLFVHWPSRVHFCFQDLLRCGKYGNLFGRFVGLDSFFEQVYDPGYSDSFSADEYRSNEFERQLAARQPDLVSRWVRFWKSHSRLSTLRASWAQWVAFQGCGGDGGLQLGERLSQLQSRLELETESNDSSSQDELGLFEKDWLSCLLAEMGAEEDPAGDALIVLNGHCGPRTQRFSLPPGESIDGEACLLDCGSTSQTDSLVSLDGYSMATLRVSQRSTGTNPTQLSLVDEHRLRNEFFELEIDARRGGIQGVNLYERRKNLLSQRLALRQPAQDTGRSASRYAEMECDQIEVVANSPVVGEIATRGRLMDQGQLVGEFQQLVRVVRGSRVIEVEVELEPRVPLACSSGHYFCSRLAWQHDSEDLLCGVQGVRTYAAGQWIQSPSYIEIVDPERQITLLPGGLPFHRRSSSKTLDTILIPAGESARTFRFGLGLNLPYGEVAARDFITAPLSRRVSSSGERLIPQSLSKLRFSKPNVIPVWWEPVVVERERVVGLRIRLREVQGRAGQLQIDCQRAIQSACKLNLKNEFLQDLETRRHQVLLNFHSFDYVQIQLNWNA